MVIQYILDTDHATLLQQSHPAILHKVNTVGQDRVGFTIITVEEQVRGWLNAARKASQVSQVGKLCQAYRRFRYSVEFFNQYQMLDLTEKAFYQFIDLRHQGIRIGTQDLRIAAICLVHQLTLVTRNQQDFAQIPGLVLEDWTQ
jgi:tRNA(fMet)-specific endonuclease VapC